MKIIFHYFISISVFLSILIGNIPEEDQELALHHFMQGEFLTERKARLDFINTSIVGEVDTIASGDVGASSNYTTNSSFPTNQAF